jgi:hypothetical protein
MWRDLTTNQRQNIKQILSGVYCHSMLKENKSILFRYANLLWQETYPGM